MRIYTFAIAILLLTYSLSSAGEIHDAARAGDVDLIDQLVESGVDVNEVSPFGSPLHFAVMRDQLGAAQKLVGYGADINAESKALGTPLHLAVRNANIAITKLLIHAGVIVDVRDKDEFTPLHFAALEGSTEIVGALLDAGADAKALAFGPGTAAFETGLFEPLQLSEKHGHAEVSELLRAAGGGPKPVEPVSELIKAADPERGRELATTRCITCHVLGAGETSSGSSRFGGPPITGIYGRDVATMEEFDYSPALKAFGGTWTEDRLYAWILHPMLTVPGVLMPEVKGFTASDVADVVAYLKSVAN